MADRFRKKVATGLAWSFAERILAQGVSFVVSLILARILMPEQYGVVSIVLVFINIANVFVSDGLGQALIQKKNASQADFATIFTVSHIISWVIYLILFFTAPVISVFYDNDLLTPVIRVISLKLPLASINTIQHAYVSKKMDFKRFFFSTLGGTVVSGVVGIWMAIYGFGVWALVAQYLVNSTIDTLILLFTVKWKPQFSISNDSLHELFGFGFQMMISSLINTVYAEMQSLVIGKAYSPSDLAFYKKGGQFPSLFINNVNSAVSSVLFPAMSTVGDDVDKLKRLTQQSMRTTSYIIVPLMLGLIAISRPLVLVLLTEKWLPCVPYLRLAAIMYMMQPIQSANCQAIKAFGRSDVYLKMEVIKKLFGVAALIFALKKGVYAIALACVISVAFSMLVSIFPNKRLLNYGIISQIKDLFPSFVMGVIMLICILPISMMDLPNIVILGMQVIAGIVLYVVMSVISKNESFYQLIAILCRKERD